VLSALGKNRRGRGTYNEAATGPDCIGLQVALSMVALDVMKEAKELAGVHLTVVEALSPHCRARSSRHDLALAYNPPRMPASMSNCRRRKTSISSVIRPIGRSSADAFSAISTKRGGRRRCRYAIIQTVLQTDHAERNARSRFIVGLRMALEAGSDARSSPRHCPSRPGGEKYHAPSIRRRRAPARWFRSHRPQEGIPEVRKP
jgi:LysR family nitrogen assimilation transcriptional regulator